MLEHLETRDTGPAASMALDLSPRLNVFAGDNGLGKTFVLDLAWWALTGTWAAYPAEPKRGEGVTPTLAYRIRRGADVREQRVPFDFSAQWWGGKYLSVQDALKPDLVLYARVDGGYSVWDPMRLTGEHQLPLGQTALRMSSEFSFDANEVWDGLQADDPDKTVLCNGLIRDWATWQLQGNGVFDTLTRVLAKLSPNDGETIRPGTKTTRISVHDVRDIPTLELPYGTIPIVHASAGMRRILSLAYLLVWTWREHVEAAKLKNMRPATSLTIIMDEVESHLHPQWQRVILPAILAAIPELEKSLTVQILATTHAPLVLASLEPEFDEARDALFLFELEKQRVSVSKALWRTRGDASSWLTSEVFHLEEARSVEAEAAIHDAMAAMRQPSIPIEEVKRVHHALRAVLKDTDTFWPRWLVRAKHAGIEP